MQKLVEFMAEKDQNKRVQNERVKIAIQKFTNLHTPEKQVFERRKCTSKTEQLYVYQQVPTSPEHHPKTVIYNTEQAWRNYSKSSYIHSRLHAT